LGDELAVAVYAEPLADLDASTNDGVGSRNRTASKDCGRIDINCCPCKRPSREYPTRRLDSPGAADARSNCLNLNGVDAIKLEAPPTTINLYQWKSCLHRRVPIGRGVV
jgi:hypothetical protein